MKYYNIIIFYIFFISLLLEVISEELGNKTGAYSKTPDANNIQYRNGNALDKGEEMYFSYTSDLLKYAGYNTMRKKFIEQDIEREGELNFLKRNKELGISDIIGFLTTPIKDHSSNRNNNDKYKPLNLYERIWISENEVNPENYWANYTYNIISKYKDYIKIWTVWYSPDYTTKSGNIKNWILYPPNSSDLDYWNAPIFDFIRMMRITYEVAKKIDPDCWVSVSTLKHYEFLDALMRYSDNPNNGTLNDDYPDYGGAYFDCVGFIQYPDEKVIDIETNQIYNKIGSDSLVQKINITKKNFESITKKYGFGIKYPKKIFINEETGLGSDKSCNGILGDENMRINWIIKLSLLSLEYDIKHNHNTQLTNYKHCSYADYENFEGYVYNIEKSFKLLKSSSKVRKILRKIHLEKYIFDKNKTSILRKNLSKEKFGIVLKRKSPKEIEDEYEYDYDYIYSIWLICENEEISESTQFKLNIPFNPLIIDYNGKEKNATNSSEISISGTPIFLLGNIDHEEIEGNIENEENDENEKNKEDKEKEKESNNIKLILFVIFGFIIILIIVGLSFLLYRKFRKKQNNIDNNMSNNNHLNNEIENYNKMELLKNYTD